MNSERLYLAQQFVAEAMEFELNPEGSNTQQDARDLYARAGRYMVELGSVVTYNSFAESIMGAQGVHYLMLGHAYSEAIIAGKNLLKVIPSHLRAVRGEILSMVRESMKIISSTQVDLSPNLR